MAKKIYDKKCKDCECWYGNEDDEYGPCNVKHGRGDKRFITHGDHPCDEEMEENARAPCRP